MTTAPDNDRSQDRLYLPDFCAPATVLGVILIVELVAIALTLARQPDWTYFFGYLGRTSMLLLWIGLSISAVLCVLKGWISRFPLLKASAVAFVVVIAVIILISETVYWIGYFSGLTDLGDTDALFPSNHWFFLSRNVAVGALVTAAVLRYFYVSSQWQRNVKSEAQTRIHALQARIRPHFLFNSMNTIAALTRSNPKAAEAAVEDLADLFRASLSDSKELIRIDQELEISRVYQRMEQQRLGKRLSVNWQVDDLPGSARIPSLTLQPLLENAINHGIEPLPEPGMVEIEGRRKGDMIYISVRNPLPINQYKSEPGNQIAMNNIRDRLELAFGPRAGLSLAVDQTHYEVSIAFPFVE